MQEQKKPVELFFLNSYNMIILIQQIEISHEKEMLSISIV